ncbi:MAG: hypothetical protein ACLSVG_04535 [Clostridia bacterium]
MDITYWYGPPRKFLTPETYEDVKNAGFTIAGPMESTGSSVEENLRFLDICQEKGMKACIYDQRIDLAMIKYRDGEADWDQTLKRVTEDYKHHKALYSYYITDEPQTGMFKMLGAIVGKLREYDPQHPGYINLLPNYATPEQYGSPTYYDHVKEYIETVKPAFVSYDHYHFLHFTHDQLPEGYEVEETADERENAIRRSAMVSIDRAGFFENLEIVRSLCRQYGLPFMVIVLLIEHGPYRNLTEAELRFEAFQTLTYGASMLSYFTYWTVIEPGSWWNWKNGCISCEGEKLQHYYDVQKINRELHTYAAYLDGKKSLSVSHYGEIREKVERFTGNILSDKPVQLTIGAFEGGYTAIANKDFQQEAVFSMDFEGQAERLDLEKNRFLQFDTNHIVIKPGDMALIRIK